MSIVLAKLYKRFENNLVVNDVSLEIIDGELFVLLGSSGSGKSTILRMIAGLLDPDAGKIEISGNDVTGLAPQERGVGFVFQNYSLFQHLTVFENVEFGLRVRKFSRQERRKSSRELLEAIGLTGLGERYPHQLSGGQQQRVAVARALAYKPTVLLLDEPFGALDVKIRARMRKRLKEIQRNLKVTTILVTHDQEEAFELADRIGVVDRGRILEVGTPYDLYHQPQNDFVATFIGGGNVLAGRVRNNRLWLGKRNFPIPDTAPKHESGDWMRILFRPETVHLSTAPFAADSKIQTIGFGQINELVFSGSQQKAMVEIEDLTGIRPLSPHSSYGQKGTTIEAIIPPKKNTAEMIFKGSRIWVGIKQFHVLESGGMKVLICTESTKVGIKGASWGNAIVNQAKVRGTILRCPTGKKSDDQVVKQLDLLIQEEMAKSRIEVNSVDKISNREVAIEAQSGYYDFIIAGTANALILGRINILNLVADASLPLLLVQTISPFFGQMLICTAAGEPGKSDVLFAGRLARRLNLGATVFYVRSNQVDEYEKERSNDNLLKSQTVLKGLGIKAEVRTRTGTVLQAILEEIQHKQYGMIVLGAPFSRSGIKLKSSNLVERLIQATTLPILVVPMFET